MKQRFRRYIIIQGLAVLLVVVVFKVMPEKRWASVVASSLFLVSSLLVLWLEKRNSNYRKNFSFWSTAIFLIFLIFPTIIIRAMSWDGSFEETALLGITGGEFHKASNYGFMLVLASYFVDSLREQMKLNKIKFQTELEK